ncbi:MAG: DMT family transporter [Spirochaetes bacterium]|nr:DMT family transporter [Spirochaetota bacterium]
MILALISALFSSICWAHNSIVYTLAGERVGSKTVANIRLWFSIPFSIIFNLIFLKSFIPIPTNQISFYLYSLLSGFLGFFLADLLIFEAFVLIGPKNTLITLTLTPVFNIIFGYLLFKDIFNIKQIIGSFFVIIGIIGVIYFDNNSKEENISDQKIKKEEYFIGFLLAVGGAFIQSLGSVFAKYSFNSNVGPFETNFYRLIGGFVGINLYSLIKKELKNDFLKMKDKKSVFLISFGALVGPVLGVSAALYSIKKISIGLTSVLTNLSPAFVVPMEYFIMKKKINKVVLIFILISILGTIAIFI